MSQHFWFFYWQILRPFLWSFLVSTRDDSSLSCMRSEGQPWPWPCTLWRPGLEQKDDEERRIMWHNSPQHTFPIFSIVSVFCSSLLVSLSTEFFWFYFFLEQDLLSWGSNQVVSGYWLLWEHETTIIILQTFSQSTGTHY